MMENEKCSGTWMVGLSGEKIYFEDADFGLNQWDLEEIAGALSNICRYGGHMPYFYSVAQHSVICSLNVDTSKCKSEEEVETLERLALFHDTAEAFLGDLPRPMKRLPQFAFFHEMEESFLCAILTKFLGRPDFPAHMFQAVKDIDNRVLVTERRDLLDENTYNHHWGPLEDIPPLEETIYPLAPEVARYQFLERAGELGIDL